MMNKQFAPRAKLKFNIHSYHHQMDPTNNTQIFQIFCCVALLGSQFWKSLKETCSFFHQNLPSKKDLLAEIAWTRKNEVVWEHARSLTIESSIADYATVTKSGRFFHRRTPFGSSRGSVRKPENKEIFF